MWAVATTSSHTTGAFTSASHIVVLVLRAAAGKVLGVGASSTGNANNVQNIVYPALTLQSTGGSSWGVRCGTRAVAVTAVGTAPTSYTAQSVQPTGAGALMSVHTRSGLVANPTADTVATAGTNAAMRAHSIEVLEITAPVPLQEVVIDDFNRADGQIDAGAGAAIWTRTYVNSTDPSDVRVISNRLGSGVANWQSAHTKLALDNAGGDVDVLIDCVTVPAGNNEFGLYCLMTAPGSASFACYAVFWAQGTWILRRYAAGASAGNLASVAGLLAAGDTIWLSKRGSALKVYRRASGGDFQQILSATDANHNPPTGVLAVEVSDVTGRWDNLRGGPLYTSTPISFGVSGITSPQTFGALTTRRFFGAGGVAPAAAFGTPKANRRLLVAGISSPQAFGAPAGMPQFVVVQGVPPSGYDLHIVGEYLAGQALVGWTGGTQFGTPLAKNLDFVGVGGVLSAQSFGAVTIKAVISRALVGIPSAQSFGKVSLRFVLAGVPSAQSFGTPIIIAVSGLVVPPGVGSAQAFGTPRFRLIALVAGLASAQAFGTIRPRLYVQASGVVSAQAFGALSFKLRFGGTGVGSAQAFGTLGFSFRKSVLGVSSAQSFGVPKALFLVRPLGLGSAQAFGQIVIRSGPVWVVVTGLGSAQAFGIPTAYNAFLYPVSCLGVDLVGVPDYGEVLVGIADTSVSLTNGVDQAVDLDAVTCVSVALDPVEIAR